MVVDSCEDGKFAMFDAVLLSGMVKVIGESKEVRNVPLPKTQRWLLLLLLLRRTRIVVDQISYRSAIDIACCRTHETFWF